MIVLLILDHEKACTTKRLAKIIGNMQSQRSLCNVLARLSRLGLVKSMRSHTFRFINPNYSLPENATSPKEKIHQLQKSLEEIWESNPDFRKKAYELFECSDIDSLRTKIGQLLKEKFKPQKIRSASEVFLFLYL
jgi:hypothetical protein